MLYPDEFRTYCLSKKGVTEELPFGPDVLVFKVMGKMFALTGLDNDIFSMNLKYDADQIDELRSKYPAVTPGYHMNKKHWNTVIADGTISKKELLRMIDRSYDLIVQGLPVKLRAELENL